MLVDERFKALAGNHVSAEDFLPPMVREALPDDVHVVTRIANGLPEGGPTVLLSEKLWSYPYQRAMAEMDPIDLEAHVFTSGVDAEADGFNLAWGVWHTVEALARESRVFNGGRSSIAYARLWERPRIRPDWADTNGPVQYQDLPQGVVRHVVPMRIIVHHHVTPERWR